MNVKAFEITKISIVCTKLALVNNKENIKDHNYWPFVGVSTGGLTSQKASNLESVYVTWRLLTTARFSSYNTFAI